jgi:hypothetical protein
MIGRGATRFGSSFDVSQELRCPAQRRLLRSVCRHCARELASPIALMRMLLSACCRSGACRWICPRVQSWARHVLEGRTFHSPALAERPCMICCDISSGAPLWSLCVRVSISIAAYSRRPNPKLGGFSRGGSASALGHWGICSQPGRSPESQPGLHVPTSTPLSLRSSQA